MVCCCELARSALIACAVVRCAQCSCVVLPKSFAKKTPPTAAKNVCQIALAPFAARLPLASRARRCKCRRANAASRVWTTARRVRSCRTLHFFFCRLPRASQWLSCPNGFRPNGKAGKLCACEPEPSSTSCPTSTLCAVKSCVWAALRPPHSALANQVRQRRPNAGHRARRLLSVVCAASLRRALRSSQMLGRRRSAARARQVLPRVRAQAVQRKAALPVWLCCGPSTRRSLRLVPAPAGVWRTGQLRRQHIVRVVGLPRWRDAPRRAAPLLSAVRARHL